MGWMRKVLGVVLLGGLCLVVVGCKVAPKPIRFHNMIAQGNQKLEEAGKKFRQAVSGAGAGAANASSATGAMNDAANVVRDLTRQFNEMAAPKYGDSLMSAYRDYLKAQQRIVDEVMRPIIDVLKDDKNFDDPRARGNEVNRLLAKATTLEKAAWDTLEKASFEFCKSHVLEAK